MPISLYNCTYLYTYYIFFQYKFVATFLPFSRHVYMSYTLVTNVRNPRQCVTKVKTQVNATGASIDAPVTNSMPINFKSTL